MVAQNLDTGNPMIDKPGQISKDSGQGGVSRPNPDKSKRRSPPPRPAPRRDAILAAVAEGCNRSSDIADELDIPGNVARAWITRLVQLGYLKRTGLVIKHTGGSPALCFEPTRTP